MPLCGLLAGNFQLVAPQSISPLILSPWDSSMFSYYSFGAHGRQIATVEDVRNALAPSGNPSYATVLKVVKALGFQLTLAPAGEVLGKSQDLAS